MIKKHYKEVEEEPVKKANSTSTSVRWLITSEDGPCHFATRRFEIQPGGEIGIHSHEEEHHIYVLDGQAELSSDKGGHIRAQKGDVIYISPNENHGMQNTSKKPFIFICIIPYLV